MLSLERLYESGWKVPAAIRGESVKGEPFLTGLEVSPVLLFSGVVGFTHPENGL